MAQIEGKLLTITIPTYNRSQYLVECLNHVCPQLSDSIKLEVRDNCSDNYDFWELIKPYQDKYGVEARQNKVNIGGDANWARIFENCETKWLWILGDDDYVSPNALSIVLSTLKNNPDEIFVKFNALKPGRFFGLSGFADAMKPKGAFGQSFFLSEGVHNVEKTKDELFFQYRYLSTSISQILRVMTHLTKVEDASCLFVEDQILEEHGRDITWSHFDIVPYQALIFDIFRPYRKILKNNVYRDIVRYCWEFISNSSLSFIDKWYYYRLFIHKFGLFNTIRYNSKDITLTWVHALLNDKLRSYIKNNIIKPRND